MRWKVFAAAAACVALAGCAAQLRLIDTTTGQRHEGTTGSTLGSSGEASVAIEGVTYTGDWIYSSGGSYSIGSTNTFGAVGAMPVAATGTVTGFTLDARGGGMMHFRAPGGQFIRCVFDFSEWTNTGTGQCLRNDGRQYDLTVRR